MPRRRSVQSRRRRDVRKQRKRKLAILTVSLILLTGVAVGVLLLFFYNPMLEKQLRAQFGDAFFSDFGISASKGEGQDLDSIIANYEPAFLELEAEALGRLEELFDSAIEDYRLQEKEGALDSFVLTNKYIQAGRLLERNVDKVFDELLADMKEELINLGLPTDIAEEVKETYQQAKEEKKRELFDRLRSTVGG